MLLQEVKRTYQDARTSPAHRMCIIEALLREVHHPDSGNLEYFLVEVLDMDPDPIVRHEAAFVLGRLKERGHITGNIAETSLCKATCSDISVVVRHEAAESLRCFDSERVEHTLFSLLNDSSPDIRATAIISLDRRKLRLQSQENE